MGCGRSLRRGLLPRRPGDRGGGGGEFEFGCDLGKIDMVVCENFRTMLESKGVLGGAKNLKSRLTLDQKVTCLALEPEGLGDLRNQFRYNTLENPTAEFKSLLVRTFVGINEHDGRCISGCCGVEVLVNWAPGVGVCGYQGLKDSGCSDGAKVACAVEFNSKTLTEASWGTRKCVVFLLDVEAPEHGGDGSGEEVETCLLRSVDS